MQNILIVFGANYLFIAIVVIAGAYFLKQSSQEQKSMIILACIALPLAYIISRISSLIYFDPRPFVTGNFVPLIPHAPDNGFPSDHTLISATIAAIVYFSHRKLGLVLLTIAFMVGFSRMLAGVHSLVDIIGSIVIAVSTTWLANFIYVRYCGVSSLNIKKV